MADVCIFNVSLYPYFLDSGSALVLRTLLVKYTFSNGLLRFPPF
jgi:hypothetical protein